MSSFIFNRATAVSRVLVLTLISFPKNAAGGKCLAEVLFLKENKSTLLFPQGSVLCFCFYVSPCCFSSLKMSKQPAEKNGQKNHFTTNLN